MTIMDHGVDQPEQTRNIRSESEDKSAAERLAEGRPDAVPQGKKADRSQPPEKSCPDVVLEQEPQGCPSQKGQKKFASQRGIRSGVKLKRF